MTTKFSRSIFSLSGIHFFVAVQITFVANKGDFNVASAVVGHKLIPLFDGFERLWTSDVIHDDSTPCTSGNTVRISAFEKVKKWPIKTWIIGQ